MQRRFPGCGVPVAALAAVLLVPLAGCGNPCEALRDCCAGLPYPAKLACQRDARSGDPALCRRTLLNHRQLGYCVSLDDDGVASLDPFGFDDDFFGDEDPYEDEGSEDESSDAGAPQSGVMPSGGTPQIK